jgi:hypothetical protein
MERDDRIVELVKNKDLRVKGGPDRVRVTVRGRVRVRVRGRVRVRVRVRVRGRVRVRVRTSILTSSKRHPRGMTGVNPNSTPRAQDYTEPRARCQGNTRREDSLLRGGWLLGREELCTKGATGEKAKCRGPALACKENCVCSDNIPSVSVYPTIMLVPRSHTNTYLQWRLAECMVSSGSAAAETPDPTHHSCGFSGVWQSAWLAAEVQQQTPLMQRTI